VWKRLKAWCGDVAAGAATLFFPSLCRGCGVELAGGGPPLFCGDCRRILAEALPSDWRGSCRLEIGPAAYGRFPYDGPAGAAVRLLKYEGRREMAALLADGLTPLAAAVTGGAGADAVVPVPLHPRRRRERRFNQAVLIGARVAAALNVPLVEDALARIRDTTPQVKLAGGARLRNVAGAFAARRPVAGKRLVLVDDVITTGATVRECAGVLWAAGAATVVCVAAARGGA